jgi:hypothetical protein
MTFRANADNSLLDLGISISDSIDVGRSKDMRNHIYTADPDRLTSGHTGAYLFI